MNRTHVYTLTASLCLVAAAGCRDDANSNPPGPVDMATGEDMAMTGADMTTPPDQSQPADLTGYDLQIPAGQAPTEFMVVKIGDGATAYGSNIAAPVYIEKHSISTGALVGTAIALPTTTTGASKRLTLTASSTAEGGLSLSGDGKYLVIVGYDNAVNDTGIPSGTANRVIGRIDAAGTVDTSTSSGFLSGTNPRGAASTDGNDLWAAGSSGIFYTTLGSTTTPTAAIATGNFRWMQVLSGQLYVTSGAGTIHGVATVGSGAPKTTTTATLLPGFSSTSGSPYGFVAFDTVSPAGIDVIYMADDASTSATGGVQRWDLKGGTWTLTGTLKKGLSASMTGTTGARAVTGFRNATSFTLLVTTAEASPRVVKFTDDGSAMDQNAATELIAATTNVVYRGISLPAK